MRRTRRRAASERSTLTSSFCRRTWRYTDGDIEKAGTALGNVNTDYLSDDSMTVYDTINAQVNAEYISAVYKEATDAYNAQEFTAAIEDYPQGDRTR